MCSTRNCKMWVMLSLAVLVAGGCASAGRHVYESTATRPATVMLVDVLNHETVWTKAVPAEHHLVVRLKREGEPMALLMTGQPATSLSWALYETPRSSINEGMWRNHVTDGEVQLDGRPVRIEVAYHDATPRSPLPQEEPEPAVDEDEPDSGSAEQQEADENLAGHLPARE